MEGSQRRKPAFLVRFVTDRTGLIGMVEGDWTVFGRTRTAPRDAIDAVGLSIWEILPDASTRQLLRHLLKQAEAGQPILVPYARDAAESPQSLLLRVAALPESGGFEWMLVQVAAHERRLRVCSWCGRAQSAGGWLPLDAFLLGEGMFIAESVQEISHGICPECSEQANLPQPERQESSAGS